MNSEYSDRIIKTVDGDDRRPKLMSLESKVRLITFFLSLGESFNFFHFHWTLFKTVSKDTSTGSRTHV